MHEVQASINGPSVTSDFLCGRCFYLSRHDAGASISGKFSGIDLAVETGSACPFLEIGRGASIAVMAVVGVACGSAAIGLGRDAEWGRRLAIGILSANLVGDSVNALLRHDPKTLIGLPIGGLMIWYLVKKRVSAEK